ncbi:hypothetical protein HYV10_02120 [Candidatus Dependentiae bacterium]|nr:hypothetical protein [Candidatus Dependentiae bacterium]
MQLSNIFTTLRYMLERSILTMRYTLPDKIINHLYWVILNIVVFSYIMPHAPSVGISSNYGLLVALSMPISAAFFGAINCMYGLLYDVTNEGSHLRYELTLPIPQWLVFTKYGIEISIQTFIATSVLFPVVYIMLFKQITFTLVSIIKFYLILMATSLFSGFFSVFIVSMAQDILQGLDNVWIRIVFPMWFLGCFQFSWSDLYTINPIIAYADLCNPLTWALEASRSSIVTNGSVLNFWLCILALIIFTLIFGYIGTQRLLKRMDCL